MKKIAFYSLILVAIGTAGCKKDYTCTCYDHFGNTDTSSQIKAKNTEEAIEICGEDINFGQHASCGVNEQ